MKGKKIDVVDKKRLDKYFAITQKAFGIVKKNVNKRRVKDAEEIILMVGCYLEDAGYFEKKKDYVNAFACLNYAHGWLDAGSRLGIFDVTDNKLFVIK